MTDKALRQVAFLRRRYRIIVGYTGLIGAIVGALVLTPLMLLPFYPEEVALARGFLLPGLLLIGVGAGFWWRLAFRQPSSLTYQEGTVIVVLSWGIAIVCGAIPLMMVSDLSLTQALFESTSGWTTTGLSVVDITAAPRLILFYRSVMQLAGGAGLAILMLSALAGPAGAGISSAEGRAELLVPHVRRSANAGVEQRAISLIFRKNADCASARTTCWAAVDGSDH